MKNDQNTLPNNSADRESLKNKDKLESSTTNVPKDGEGLLRAFYKLFCLRFSVSNNKWKIHCVAKILYWICDRFLYENNRNYNCYKFIYKFAFIPFLPFFKNQTQESNSRQVGDLVTFKVFVFFIALYFKGMPNSRDFQKRIF